MFHGEESYLKEYYLSLLEKQCAGAFADFNIIKLQGASLTAQAFITAVESLPMGERKVVEIFDYPLFAPHDEFKELLPKMLSDLPEYICLVFVYDALEYKADKRLAVWKTAEKYGQIVEFKRAAQATLSFG